MTPALYDSQHRRVVVKRHGALLWWLLGLLAAASLGVLFGRWAFVPPAVDTAVAKPATVTVSDMAVGTTIPVAVSAAWEEKPFGVGAASGVLTSLDVADGDTVEAGQELYTVDLRPVFAARGEVPAFRDLTQDTTGTDVAQLQQLLTDAGFFNGPINGRYLSGTAAAVRAWQRSVGLPVDGVVRAGDLVFTPELPARVRLAEGTVVGQRLAPGDVVLSVLAGEPEFRAVTQFGSNVDGSLPIEVTFAGETVTTTVVAQSSDTGGNTILTLRRPDGSAVCADRCNLVPLNAQEAVFPANQVVVATVSGPGVPAAAVWFTAGGEAYLMRPDGSQLPVTIVGQGQGRVVLDGVEVGEVVLIADETESN